MEADTALGQSVTREQRQRWESDGYLKIDPGCSPGLIDKALAELEHHYIYEGEEKVENGIIYSPGRSPRIRDAWKLSEAVKAIALLPRVLAIIEELHGREPLPFQTLNFPKPTQQAPHSDAIHFNTDPPGDMCGVWVAFEDVDMANGPLVYYPGSHQFPYTRYEDVGFEEPKDSFPSYNRFIQARNKAYERHVAALIERHGLKPEYGTMAKGEAIIWSANLLHGGTPQQDKTRTRHSQVTHYLFNSSGYYTEMQTEGDNRVWKKPDWIG
jgi:ectoine hydroxylase-related dioxygenase (phytanoyl-CoA dioxygenase family)